MIMLTARFEAGHQSWDLPAILPDMESRDPDEDVHSISHSEVVVVARSILSSESSLRIYGSLSIEPLRILDFDPPSTVRRRDRRMGLLQRDTEQETIHSLQ